MSTLLRYLEKPIRMDLKEKMVFLGGPRQVGQTTLALDLLSPENRQSAYLNWDNPTDKKRFLNRDWPANSKLIVFDELHKYKKWRNTIKGYWDTLKTVHRFLVTGSARLDLYRRGGDSLLGRYHYYRLHPLSWPEVLSQNLKPKNMEHLLKFGGFPEPFLRGDEKYLRRWHAQRLSRIVSDDIRDLEHIRELSLLDLLIHSLPERVGSPLSRKSLAEDLEVDFKSIERWIAILERVYYCYRISPYGAPRIRAVKKEQKLYLWDWSEHSNKGKLWENFVASHLLKFCHFKEDTEGYKMELRFLRDTDGREVDFVVLQDKKPLFAVECKSGEGAISRHIPYFCDRTSIPKFYQVHTGSKHIHANAKIELLPFKKFCELERLV